MPSAIRSPYLGFWLTLATVMLCSVLFIAVSPTTLEVWTGEAGFFEIGSAVGWFTLAAVLAVLAFAGIDRRFSVPAGIILLAFGMRELDWHKAFTADSMLKSNYYLDLPAPLLETAISAAVVLGLLSLLGYLVVTFARPLLHALRRREAGAMTLANGIVLLVFSKLVDRSLSVAGDDWGWLLPDWAIHLQRAVEEPLEFFLPIFFALALGQYLLVARRPRHHAPLARMVNRRPAAPVLPRFEQLPGVRPPPRPARPAEGQTRQIRSEASSDAEGDDLQLGFRNIQREVERIAEFAKS